MEIQPKKPLTIGYLAPNVAEGNGLLLRQGILAQAKALNIRLVTFSGGELHYPEPFFHQANQVYELADRHQLDGLIIWTSSLATFIGQEAIQNFCDIFSPLPVVGLGVPLPNVPSIVLESYKGMKQAILHMVQVHGKRSMVFIRGPELHYDAQERMRAYLDVVSEYGLDSNPNLITPPCRWIVKDAEEMMRILVEERGIQFDSIASVNDQLAYGAVQYLQRHGYRLPEDIAIVGFDNNPIGRFCSPPLTTVPNKMRERGRQAVSLLFNRINGEAVPEVITLSTEIKIRQSCGCQDPYIVQAGKPTELFNGVQAVDLRSHIIRKLQTVLPSADDNAEQAERLLAAYNASLTGQAAEEFLTTLRGLLQPFIESGLGSREWQAVLSELRQWTVSQYQTKPEWIEFGDRLIHMGRVMIAEITSRYTAQLEWLRNQRLNDLHSLRQTISANETLDFLLDNLAEELPKLGIAYGFLALYQNPNQPLDGARLVLAFDQQGRLPGLEGQFYSPSSNLTHPASLVLPDITNSIVHSLYFGSEQLGFLVVDASSLEGSSHQILREQISSALKSVLLIEQNVHLYKQARKNQQLAEEANTLKSRFLSIVSHELLTPIVLLVGLSEMMLREEISNRPELPDAYRQDLTRIHTSAQQLGSLVRDVLDLARSQLGQLTLVSKPIDISDVLKPLELVCEQMATSKGLEWEFNLPEKTPMIYGDTSRLQQVVLNLFSNAVKFTSQGSVKISVEVEDNFIIVSVIDTGLSVSLDEQEVIFDEFHQSERTVTRGYGGLGIGLAICRQLVELHGGKIGVDSTGEENSGSTFYFSLPVLSSLTPDKTPEQSQAVLILTDQVARSKPLRQHLEQNGFQVLVLNTAQDPNWLEKLAAYPQGALVLDYEAVQPGLEILEVIKRNPATQDLPVIFYSLVEEKDSGSMFTLDYLEKPVADVRLTRILGRYGITPECRDKQTVLVVDDDPEIREFHARLILEHLPDCQVITADNGRKALEIMHADPPDLVLLDLRMPEVDGMTVLKTMQEQPDLQGIPVVVLTAQQLSVEDMKVLNESVSAVLSKGVFTATETLDRIEQTLVRQPQLGTENQRLVRKVMAYIHENYNQPINRKDLAEYASVSERHLNRCFNLEIGITSLNYLNRYRILQAKTLLKKNKLSIAEVMNQVGFSDNSHFSHVFRREVGVSPSDFKRGKRSV